MRSLPASILLSCVLSALNPLPLSGARAEAPKAQASVDPAARAAFEAGREAYDRGRFGEALSHFERAYRLSPSPILLFNIGRAAESDLQNQRALEAYTAYLKAVPNADNREFVEARIEKIRQVDASAGRPTQPAPAPAPTQPAPAGSPAGSALVQPYPAPYVYDPSGAGSHAPARVDRRSIPGLRLYAGFRVGVGGSGTVNSGFYSDLTTDLKATPGLQLGIAYAWRFFQLGAEIRNSWFGLEEVGDRFRVTDVVFKPKGGYQLTSIPLEFYGTLPIGVSIPEDALDTDTGATVGLQVGASYFFARHVGMNIEMGPMWHILGDLTLSQWNLLSANAMFAF